MLLTKWLSVCASGRSYTTFSCKTNCSPSLRKPSWRKGIRVRANSSKTSASSGCAPRVARRRSFGRIVTVVKVVDASALAALIFSEPEADAIVERLNGAKLAAPSLLDDELANICLVKSRRERRQRDTLRAAFGMHHRLRVETVAVDHLGILDLAETTGLTADDARYLWVARSLGGIPPVRAAYPPLT